MIDPRQLRDLIVIPTLKHIDRYSENAVRLLLATCAVESDMGKWLKQRPNGPALGPYQVEPNTHQSIIDDYLIYRPHLISKLRTWVPNIGNDLDLIGNFYYSTAIARFKYSWHPGDLPDKNDIKSMAKYWRAVYNGNSEAMTDDEAINKFMKKYKVYIEGKL